MLSYGTIYHKMSKACHYYLHLSTRSKPTLLVCNSFNVICYMFFFNDFNLLTYVHIVNIILIEYICVSLCCACLCLPKIVLCKTKFSF